MMSTAELQTLVASLSMEERRLLVEVLDEDTQKKAKAVESGATGHTIGETDASSSVGFPLRGTSDVMHEPLNLAVEPNE